MSCVRLSSSKVLSLVNSTAFISVLGLGSVSCATLPKTGTESTGAALVVDVERKEVQRWRKERVGESVVRDANGHAVTVTNFVDVPAGTDIVDVGWTLRQGDDAVDEQDFYALAGDDESASVIERDRRFGQILYYSGIGLGTVSAAALATALIPAMIPATNGAFGDGGNPVDAALPLLGAAGLTTVSLIGGLGTYALIASGHDKMTTTAPRFSREHAETTARNFNRTKGLLKEGDDDSDDTNEMTAGSQFESLGRVEKVEKE